MIKYLKVLQTSAHSPVIIFFFEKFKKIAPRVFQFYAPKIVYLNDDVRAQNKCKYNFFFAFLKKSRENF